MPTVRGNWDAFIARDDVQPWEHAQWVRDELTRRTTGAGSRTCRTSTRSCMSGQPIRFFHASPVSEFTRVFTPPRPRPSTARSSSRPRSRATVPVPTIVGYGDIHGAYLAVDYGITRLQRRLRRATPSTAPARPTSSSRATLTGPEPRRRAARATSASASSGCPTTSSPRSPRPRSSACPRGGVRPRAARAALPGLGRLHRPDDCDRRGPGTCRDRRLRMRVCRSPQWVGRAALPAGRGRPPRPRRPSRTRPGGATRWRRGRACRGPRHR